MKMDEENHEMNMDHSQMDMEDQKMGRSDMMMHGGHMVHMGNLQQKFWISLVLTIPLLLMSSMMGMTHPLLEFQGSDWVVAILGTVIFFYGGNPFFSGAKGELTDKKPANRLAAKKFCMA